MKTAILLARMGVVLGLLGVIGCSALPAAAPVSEPLDAPVRKASWEGSGAQGWRLQTANYAVYTTARGGETVSLLPAFMEASYRNYHRLAGLPFRPAAKPMPIYLLRTREEWASLTRALLGPAADKYLQIASGGYCREGVCVFWQLGGLAMLQVAGHEGLHQFLHQRMADPLPMWLEEGLCTQAEACELVGDAVRFDPARNLSRRGDLEGALMRGFWVPLAGLLRMDAGDAVGSTEAKAVGYYGQLWGLVRFLRSDPAFSAGLDRLIADAEAGRLRAALGGSPQALRELRLRGRLYNQTVSIPLFRHYITSDLSAFDKRYKDFCYRLCELK